jgi:peroxiredoxin
VLVSDRSVHEAYKIRSIPTTFVIGRNGRIAKRHVGFHPSMAEGMRAEIENLLEVQGEGV